MNAVLLLSGGIDSTVALAQAIHAGSDIAAALTFDYGQQHHREIVAAGDVAAHYKINHQIIDLRRALSVTSALTDTAIEIPEKHAEDVDATFVPGRNIVMLAVAIAYAENICAGAVIIGSNADDNAGYPDCRLEFITAIDEAARLGTTSQVGVWAPLVRMTKTDIVALGRQLDAPLQLTWSCYRGGDAQCGRCGACESNRDALAVTE